MREHGAGDKMDFELSQTAAERVCGTLSPAFAGYRLDEPSPVLTHAALCCRPLRGLKPANAGSFNTGSIAPGSDLVV